MTYILFVILTFAISAAIGWFAIPRIVIIAKIKRLFDEHNARKVHKGAIPRLGGLSFFPAALFSFAFVLGLRYYYGYDISFDLQLELLTEFLFVMSGMLILYFVGMVDDLIGVGYRSKFIAQIFAAACLVLAGVTLFDLQGLFGIHRLPFLVDTLLTIIVVVLTVNAFNLIDGVDGLCSGLGTIILATLGTLFIYKELYVYAMFAFGMVGVLIAFFQYNVLGTRLKVFMYMLAEYATFSTANMISIAFERINLPQFSMIPAGTVTSLIGMGIGFGVSRLTSHFHREKKQ